MFGETLDLLKRSLLGGRYFISDDRDHQGVVLQE